MGGGGGRRRERWRRREGGGGGEGRGEVEEKGEGEVNVSCGGCGVWNVWRKCLTSVMFTYCVVLITPGSPDL